jgi:NAD(P)-dependent dehydrogenase (short-subunit alcohol dehydrogenase family)
MSSSSSFNVKGKVAVVTGAASGIGRAICMALSQAGAMGIAVLDINLPEAQTTAAAVTANGTKALAMRCDAGEEQDIIAAVSLAETTFGAPVACFVANAGITGTPAGTLDIGGSVAAGNSAWEACWRINVMQSVHAARVVIPGMLTRKDGAFVVTSSAAGLFTFPNGEPATYIATKHAARSWTDSLRIRYQNRGVSVHCICPKVFSYPNPNPRLSSTDSQVTLTPIWFAQLILRARTGSLRPV